MLPAKMIFDPLTSKGFLRNLSWTCSFVYHMRLPAAWVKELLRGTDWSRTVKVAPLPFRYFQCVKQHTENSEKKKLKTNEISTFLGRVKKILNVSAS